jgi:MtN3 and saliva related transmembrane protein
MTMNPIISLLLAMVVCSSLGGWLLARRSPQEKPVRVMLFVGWFWLLAFMQLVIASASYYAWQLWHETLSGVDVIGYCAAALTTGSFLPQAIKTLKTRDTESLSLGMYSLFASGVLLWLIYGLYLDNKAIIIANAITFVLAALILGFKVYNSYIASRKQVYED